MVEILKGWARAAAAPGLFLLLVVYFCVNAVQGDHGLKVYAQRQGELATAKAEYLSAVAERDAWERKVDGLRPSHLDPDTLDERSRALLNLSEPGDTVVMYGQGKNLF